MKKNFLIICLTLVVGAAFFSVGYKVGYKSYITNKKVTFIVDLSVLEDLRAGNITNAISTLELHCYSSASVALSAYETDRDRVVKMSALKLIEYRKVYAQPKLGWSPTEQKLEGQLNEFSKQ
jgi:hypothetical protein